ncbi:MAG: DUF1573 domain-containing protein [Calditrichaeota bacterium]|nr:DUF1573 domain-containing protein [Calditrichota bacterium]
MKRVASFFGTLFLVLYLFQPLAAQDSTQVKGPLIHFSEMTKDFGNVRGDTILTHIFAFKNIGSDTLHISRLKSG